MSSQVFDLLQRATSRPVSDMKPATQEEIDQLLGVAPGVGTRIVPPHTQASAFNIHNPAELSLIIHAPRSPDVNTTLAEVRANARRVGAVGTVESTPAAPVLVSSNALAPESAKVAATPQQAPQRAVFKQVASAPPSPGEADLSSPQAVQAQTAPSLFNGLRSRPKPAQGIWVTLERAGFGQLRLCYRDVLVLDHIIVTVEDCAGEAAFIPEANSELAFNIDNDPRVFLTLPTGLSFDYDGSRFTLLVIANMIGDAT